MSGLISDRSRKYLSQSLRLVEQHRQYIEAQGAEHLARSAADEPSADPDLAAAVLVDLLFAQVHRLTATGEVSGLDGVLAEHRSLRIDGRQYSRFGDALIPLLKDALGPNVPAGVPSAWCDTFWIVIGRVKKEEMALA